MIIQLKSHADNLRSTTAQVEGPARSGGSPLDCSFAQALRGDKIPALMGTKRKSAVRRKRPAPPHPDHSAQLARLKRIKGQIEGVQRMVEDRRYCPDILIQTSAVRAALRSFEVAILREHVDHCVKHAVRESGGPAAKLKELLAIFQKLPT